MASIESNPRGIPKAPFIEKVEDYISGSTEETLQKFQETISKYKFMENSLLGRQKSLNSKLPEIKKTLQMVELLIAQNEAGTALETDYELSDTLFASAKIEAAKTVYLWLGANVMLEYPIEEARSLLATKLNQATISLSQVEEDLEFLRDQVTTMEVNMARVYNWDVKQRKKQGVASKA
ncbi:hypothetical protein AMAG_13916 [Allomyces macrogynus ATCC 38327]|uniref:Prefoldin subunit 3 n=1 Tax=Allomyces macrogynus (strain ATCC 38327) TaxID=578462 RepID=A0A0L0T2W6_ALLM3|nr:hypothetical protein AMAG_13916 [Allomyces macrogynus ATCC 38327]|eukprot:KNE69042.1 hypothetical protein AMAG_13916 [Allomyces macrogynus ATCC 38327]